MPLALALEQHCEPILDRAPSNHPGLNWSRSQEAIRCIENRSTEAAQVESISRQTLPLLEEVRDNLQDQGRVNRVIGQIDLLRAQMNQYDECYQLIMQMTQSSELDRFKADRKLAASKAIGLEKQKRQVQRDIENVRSVMNAAQEFQKLMADVAARLRDQAKQHHAEAA